MRIFVYTKNKSLLCRAMLQNGVKILLSFLLLLLVVNCAKRGNPTGGPKDEDPPVFVNASPPNYSTNFEGNEIRIYFDEYIKLKDLQKQLIISPPMNPAPLITPLGSAAKYIDIEILDTLIPNTTYVFNFGNSVVDNNEGNPFSFFKYVMSTGDYIDSLSIKGVIKDALLREPDDYVTVMLYEVDSTYSDSVIYKQTPRYITNTLDSSVTFELSNLREGRYRLAALKDEDNNYTFQPEKDKIAFFDSFIDVPTDSTYTLTLFSENETNVSRPKQAGEQRVSFPYTGAKDSIDIELISEKPAGFESLISYKEDIDTLRYWYKPQIESDSLVFQVKTEKATDTLYLRKRKMKKDSLTISALTSSSLKLGDSIKLQGSIPLVALDESLISLTKADSSLVDFSTTLIPEQAQVIFGFETEENEKYTLQILPKALTDFYGSTNDSLVIKNSTKEYADYGELELTLKNAQNYPYIVQLVTESGDVKREQYAKEGETEFAFRIVNPGKYYVRLIEDLNANGVYDTGNYLARRQPETIIYYPELQDVRAGWLPKITFILGSPATIPAAETSPDLPEN
tara:strand:- start:987 stop:2693 length:1707 start_codon:yes stop_codon:yes gene_type:complete